MGTKKWTQNWGLSFVFLNGAPKMGTKNGTQNGNQKTSHLIQKKNAHMGSQNGPKTGPRKGTKRGRKGTVYMVKPSTNADAKTTACAVSRTANEAIHMVASSKELKSALFHH